MNSQLTRDHEQTSRIGLPTQLLRTTYWAIMPVVVTVFIISAAVGLFYYEVEPVAYALLLLIPITSFLAWRSIRANLDQKEDVRVRIQKVRIGIAICIPPIVMLAAFLFKSNALVAIFLWPLFIPGIYLLVKGTSATPADSTPATRRIGLSISWLTVYVIVYAVCTFALLFIPWSLDAFVALGNNNPSTLALVLVPPALGSASVLGTFYLLRNHQLDQIQSAVLSDVNTELARIDNLLEALPHIADTIQKKLDLDLFFIVRPDSNYYSFMATRPVTSPMDRLLDYKLRVIGACPISDTEVARVLNEEYTMDLGYSAEVIRTHKYLLVNDIQRRQGPSLHEGLSLTGIQAELIVPVFDLDRPDLLLALLIADSRHTNAFDTHDQETLTQVASYIAAYARRSPLGYDEQRQALDNLSGPHAFEVTVDKALLEAGKLFKTPYTAFFHLGLGTGALLPGRVTYLVEDTFAQPTFLRQDAVRINEGPVLQVVTKWEPSFHSQEQVDHLPEEWRVWQKSEGIKACAFVPVGMRSRKLGVLYLGFPHLELGFSSTLRIFLSSFAQTIMPQLGAARYIDHIYKGFLRHTISVHHFMNMENLARGTLADRMAEIEQKLEGMQPSAESTAHAELLNLLKSVTRVIDQVEAAERAELPDFMDPNEPDMLDKSIRGFWKELRNKGHMLDDMHGYIDPRVEAESSDLKLILYRILTQAIFNAINHGKATWVWYRLVRLQDRLVLDIADNGLGFNTDILASRKPNGGGILYLDSLLQKHMGSKPVCWGWTGPEIGTYAGFEIPVLYDASAPSDLVRKSRLDDIRERPPWKA